MNKSVSIQEAVDALLNHARPVSEETIATVDSDGRVLSRDVAAQTNLPPFHRSAYDGFALRSPDTLGASEGCPAVLPVIGAVNAGDFWGETLPAGCAIRIMTGAALPEGADCVINFERVLERNGEISLTAPLSSWQNADRQGDEVPIGAALFSAGEPLTPAHIGVLAAQGIDQVDVFRRPKAAILSTGSELVPPGGPLPPGRIYNSNLYLFRSLLLREGYQIDKCASLPDDAEQISDTLGQLAQNHDLILTTGGASVGDRDHAGSALERAGADILFSHIGMKPGSCCFAAVLGRAVILSLSGNPGAALTTYFRVALPMVRRIAGRHDFALLERRLPLKGDVRKTCPVPRILKGHIELENGAAYFVGHEGQKNGMQTSFLHMNALAELPPTDNTIRAGTSVRVFFPNLEGGGLR